MKYKLNLLISLIMLFSFLHSNHSKLPSNKTSQLSKIKDKKNLKDGNETIKLKKKTKNVNKAKNLNKKKEITNQDLKADLTALEESFREEKIRLRENYKKRRIAIYEKYGVEPPKIKKSK